MRTNAIKLLLGFCCLTAGSLYAQDSFPRTMVLETKDGKEPKVVKVANISKVLFANGKMQLVLSNEGTKELSFATGDISKCFFSTSHQPNRADKPEVSPKDFSLALGADELALFFPEPDRVYDLKLYTLNGLLVRQLRTYRSGEIISIAELPSAPYLIVIDSYTIKFVKP